MTSRTDAILNPAFALLADWQVTQTLNAQTKQVDGDSPILAISNALWFSGHDAHAAIPPAGGPWGKIIDDSVHHADAVRRQFLLDCLYLFEAKGAETVGWGDNPAYPIGIEASLDGLISYGYINSDLKTYIMSQRYVTVPVWDPLFTDEEVGTVRKAANFYG